MAQMLQQMNLGGGTVPPVSQQDEQDRRWANVGYEMEQLKEQGGANYRRSIRSFDGKTWIATSTPCISSPCKSNYEI
jgi:hypothetical protein